MASTQPDVNDGDKKILRFVQEQPGGFAGTPEVAEELGLTTNGAAYRLKQLEEKDLVESRQPSRDKIWFNPEIKSVNQSGFINSIFGSN